MERQRFNGNHKSEKIRADLGALGNGRSHLCNGNLVIKPKPMPTVVTVVDAHTLRTAT